MITSGYRNYVARATRNKSKLMVPLLCGIGGCSHTGSMDRVFYGVAIDPKSTPVILMPGLKTKWWPFIVTHCVFDGHFPHKMQFPN